MFYVYQLGTVVLNQLILQGWQPNFHSGKGEITVYHLGLGDIFKSPACTLPVTILLSRVTV